MLCAISCCINHQDINDNDQYVVSYDKPNLCNDYISKEQGSVNRISINFPRHCVLRHVLSDTNLLDEVDSWKEVEKRLTQPMSEGVQAARMCGSCNRICVCGQTIVETSRYITVRRVLLVQ